MASDNRVPLALAALDALVGLLRQRDEAISEVVAAAELLSRPGVANGSIEEQIAGVRMTAAVDACAALIGERRLLDPERRV